MQQIAIAATDELWGIIMRTGDYFAEKYLIERVLGKGGMGTVYLA